MNEQRIRKIASQCSDFADQIPYFRGIENGLTWEATIQKARDLKFAELIVRECIEQASISNGHGNNQWDKALTFAADNIKKHFGVEE